MVYLSVKMERIYKKNDQFYYVFCSKYSIIIKKEKGESEC